MRKRRQNHSLLVMLALIHVHVLLILPVHLVSYTPWSLASLGFSFSTIM